LTYLLKKKVYDRIIPSSDVLKMIIKQDVKKVVFGSLFLLCYLKNPKAGQSKYVLTSRSLINAEELLKHLRDSNTTYGAPLINESHIIWTVVGILYSLLFLKMIN
jgi:hypothetical protein